MTQSKPRKQITTRAPEPASLPNPLDEAVSLHRQWSESEQRETEADIASAFATIVAIVRRSANPKPGDGERLADAMHFAGVTEAQIRSIDRCLRRAAEYEESHADRDAAHLASIDAREAKKAIEKRHREEIEAASKAVSSTRNRHRHAVLAADELRNLSREWPQLFDLSQNPPRLLPADPVM